MDGEAGERHHPEPGNGGTLTNGSNQSPRPPVTLEEFLSWFEGVSLPSDRAEIEAYFTRALDFINHTSGIRPGFFEDFLSVAKLFDELADVAGDMKRIIVSIRKEIPEYWQADCGGYSLSEIDNLLDRIGPRLEPRRPIPGRPEVVWHAYGRMFSTWMKDYMPRLGYTGALSRTNPDSLTAKVGARMVSRAFGIAVDQDAFAIAMRRRDRRKLPMQP